MWRAGDLLKEAGDIRARIADINTTPSSSPRDVNGVLARLGPGAARLAREWAVDVLHGRGISDAYAEEMLAPQVRPRLGGGRTEMMSGLAMALTAAQEDKACSRAAPAGQDFLTRLREMATLPGVDVRAGSRVIGVERRGSSSRGRKEGEGEGDSDGGDGGHDTDKDVWVLHYVDALGPSEAEFDYVVLAAPGLEDIVYPYHLSGDLTASNTTITDNGDEGAEAEDIVEFSSVYLTFFTRTGAPPDPMPGRHGNGEASPSSSPPPQFLFVDPDGDGRDVSDSSRPRIYEAAHVRDVFRYGDDGDNDGEDNGRGHVEHLYRYVSEGDITELLAADPAVTWVYHQRVSRPVQA